jgi:Gly-Xaa carboxypeptidase
MIDVVPVDPTTVHQWTHPPYSGYFDGEFLLYPSARDTHLPLSLSGKRIWGRGSSDDKSGLIGILQVSS